MKCEVFARSEEAIWLDYRWAYVYVEALRIILVLMDFVSDNKVEIADI